MPGPDAQALTALADTTVENLAKRWSVDHGLDLQPLVGAMLRYTLSALVARHGEAQVSDMLADLADEIAADDPDDGEDVGC
ncbi:MAG: hypothetical protein RIM84_20955 [Alphaproteobacteria bacterium]